MLNTSLASYLVPSWFKKDPVAPASSSAASGAEIPRTFVVSTDDKYINISMNDEDDMVDIHHRPMTYAEVAALSAHKKQTSLKAAKPSKKRVAANQYTVLKEEDLDEPGYEPYKSAVHYEKHITSKHKQHQNIKDKKQKRGDARAKAKLAV